MIPSHTVRLILILKSQVEGYTHLKVVYREKGTELGAYSAKEHHKKAIYGECSCTDLSLLDFERYKRTHVEHLGHILQLNTNKKSDLDNLLNFIFM